MSQSSTLATVPRGLFVHVYELIHKISHNYTHSKWPFTEGRYNSNLRLPAFDGSWLTYELYKFNVWLIYWYKVTKGIDDNFEKSH